MDLLIVIAASLAGSILSLGGGIILLGSSLNKDKLMLYAMPFGAGALLGAALLSVLPEALHSAESVELEGETVIPWVLGGFVLFFVLERSIRWFHRHHEHTGDASHRWLIVVGDTIHNAIDGVAIGAAFLVSVPLGIATTLAVAAHEIPQEIGDFGLLLSKGMRRRNVLLVNIASAFAAVATAVATFLLGDAITPAVPLLLAVVAGCFIYIAAADIIPDIHEQPQKRANIQSLLLVGGIAVIPLTGFLLENVFGLQHTHEAAASPETSETRHAEEHPEGDHGHPH